MPRVFRSPNALRYFQFFIIVVGAGALYPIIYMRQNFETSILDAFNITTSQLGELYSLLGIVYTLCYLPSGRIADRIAPRLLMTFALAAVGALGLWFSTYPSFFELQLIFLGWGIAGGLCFWASLIKGVKMLATAREQGRFFGILDSGRGLVEALLASIAIAVFSSLSNDGASAALTLRPIIYMYSFMCILFAVLIYIFVDGGKAADDAPAPGSEESRRDTERPGIMADFMTLCRIPQLWILALILYTGHQLFWATYSFSAFLQSNFGMTAVVAGSLTLSKLWMRPLGGVTAGFLADRFGKEKLLATLFLGSSVGLLCISYLPIARNYYMILALVLVIGYFTYAIHGLYWALLDHCPIPPRLTGLAIGIVSFIGYMPDVLLPLVDGFLSRHFPRDVSFRIYFTGIAVCGLAGALLCLYFRKTSVVRGDQQI